MTFLAYVLLNKGKGVLPRDFGQSSLAKNYSTLPAKIAQLILDSQAFSFFHFCLKIELTTFTIRRKTTQDRLSYETSHFLSLNWANIKAN